MLEVIFFGAIFLIAYAYLGYPATVYVLSRLFPRAVRRATITPRVSFIIAAHNEERDIAAKLDNTLALDYPADRLEIIVASDCSSDGTEEIVRGYADRGVRLFRQEERHGKTVAQRRAVRMASGEILVFADATTRNAPDALRKLVRAFADPEVGCVAGQLMYVDGETSAVGQGCRSYWDYEKFIKASESRLNSLIGVSGCLYAVRRSHFAQLTQDMIDDFVIATEMHLAGLRTVYEPDAVAMEDTNKRARDEFRMRVRVIEQTLTALHRYRAVLNPWQHGWFAFQLLGHKALRYGVPLLLPAVFISNALLLGRDEIFQHAFLAQAALYGAAAAGAIANRLNLRIGPLALPYYFVLANAASLMGVLKFLTGGSHVVWTPIRETGAAVRQASATAPALGKLQQPEAANSPQ
ncbi:MAG TPA: glycosyltransferase family 2 protein [Blastocatellia bacterium]|nr:glycosyltransferase family 2 protein [Blastocatellia bacterium]HMY70558.1 glycosyltransferase family 2 protein [Blastocatellia bacterium]